MISTEEWAATQNVIMSIITFNTEFVSHMLEGLLRNSRASYKIIHLRVYCTNCHDLELNVERLY